MTLYPIEHAVVMDTDDIPGRGGYALVGVSRGVTQAERGFVAQNFGISDYLHDPQQHQSDERIFYSFFRVPNGRLALVRRFARGRRRNQTQNRLFIHTLFFDERLFERLHGLPWLLLSAWIRAEGDTTLDRLKDDAPWVEEGGWIPRLEWDSSDGAGDDIKKSFAIRITSLGNQLRVGTKSPEQIVATVVTALSTARRVSLPQGRPYELLTMLAWSMLPWLDREQIAWTQHDSMNLSGVAFGLANVVSMDAGGIDLEAEPSSFALDMVARTKSEETWLDFHQRARKENLTVANPDAITRWLAWRKAVEALGASVRAMRESPGKPAAGIVQSMKKLAAIARDHESDPWIDGEEILEIIWEAVPAIAEAKVVEAAVIAWGSRLHESGLDRVIFRTPPEHRWFAEATEDVGPDLLIAFFLQMSGESAAAPARDALASWLSGKSFAGVSQQPLADLAISLAADGSPTAEPALDHLLAAESGLKALVRKNPTGSAVVFAATPIVLRHAHPGTVDFLHIVFVDHLETVQASRGRVTAQLARDVASALREAPDVFVAFFATLSPELRAELTDLTTQWLFSERARTLPLAREVMNHLARHAATVNAAPLAVALADAGEPARLWFRVLLQVAVAIDSQNDEVRRPFFLTAVNRLHGRSLKVDGAMEPLVQRLAEEPRIAAGESLRALILLVRAGWHSHAEALLRALLEQVQRTYLVTGWEPVISAAAEELGRRWPVGVSALVAAYWEKVTDPSVVPNLDIGIIEALGSVTEADRERLAAQWATRLPLLPESPKSDLLETMLYPEVDAAEARIPLALREIHQGVADERTLNRLDAALYAVHGREYDSRMADALERYIGNMAMPERVKRMCALLTSKKVLQTVKRVIETRLLPRATAKLKARDWEIVYTTLTEEELFGRGVPALTLAAGIGADAGENVVRAFEGVCRGQKRNDALQAVAWGRRARSGWRRISRGLGFG